MKSKTEFLREAMGEDSRHGITLAGERYVEGYILDVSDTSVQLGEGGPMADYSQSTHYLISEISAVWFTKDGQWKKFEL